MYHCQFLILSPLHTHAVGGRTLHRSHAWPVRVEPASFFLALPTPPSALRSLSGWRNEAPSDSSPGRLMAGIFRALADGGVVGGGNFRGVTRPTSANRKSFCFCTKQCESAFGTDVSSGQSLLPPSYTTNPKAPSPRTWPLVGICTAISSAAKACPPANKSRPHPLNQQTSLDSLRTVR